jgi:Predicted hydrolase of the metallo-beta-lactamase superfamily
MHVPLPGVEKMASATIDHLYRTDAKVMMIERRILRGSHASAIDIKLLLNFTNPKYVFPVLGEARHQYAVEQIALSYGLPKNQIISLINGQVATFNHGVLKEPFDFLKVGDSLVDGSILGDVNEVVLKDRELLGRDGILFIIGNVDARAHKLVGPVELVSHGFAIETETPEVFQSIKQVATKACEDHLMEKYVEWNTMKQEVKDAVYKHLMTSIHRATLIIPIMIDTVRH